MLCCYPTETGPSAQGSFFQSADCKHAAVIAAVGCAAIAALALLLICLPTFPGQYTPLIFAITLVALSALAGGVALCVAGSHSSDTVACDEPVPPRDRKQAIERAESHPFRLETVAEAPYAGPFRITTANLGMLPSSINFFQRVGHSVSAFFTETEALLSPASARVEQIAERLAQEADRVPILCCQEVFDKESSQLLADCLQQRGYTVLHSGGAGWRLVNSGLFFATRYPIHHEGVHFWSFTRLTHADAFSAKGMLRVPLSVPHGGQTLSVIIYVTHLQAELDAQEIRAEQLESIHAQIEEDQTHNPHSLIFLAGDLNITDTEYGGIHQGEYSQNSAFFSAFYDFVDLVYGQDGVRRVGTRELDPNVPEPTGTFYRLDRFGSGEVSPGCLYDRILLYKRSALLTQEPAYHAEIRRTLDPDLSDHLPVTLCFDLSRLLFPPISLLEPQRTH